MVWFVRYLFDGSARRYRIGQHPAVGLSSARKLASVVRGRVAAGDDPQSEKRAKREAARRRRLGATVGGALATWLRDEKLGPLGRWKGGLEGGSGRTSLWHLRRLDRMLGKKLLNDITAKDPVRPCGDGDGEHAAGKDGPDQCVEELDCAERVGC